MPQTWLAVQGGTATVAALTSLTIRRMYVLQAFVKLCTHYGIPTNHKVLTVTQMGQVPMKGAGYVAQSYKEYSPTHKGTKIKLSLPFQDLPLWHSTIVCNNHHNTFLAPHLIRQRVLPVADVFDSNLELQPHMHKFLTRWWLPIS